MTSPWRPQHQPQPYGPPPQHPTIGHPAPGQPPHPGYGQGPGPRPPRRRRRGLLWGVLGGGAAVLVLIVAIVLISGDQPGPNPGDVEGPRDVADTELAPGNCLESLEPAWDNMMRLVPCETRHTAQVVAEQTITDADFDSEEAYSTQSEEYCLAESQNIIPDDVDAEQLSTHSFYPTADTWQDGDRLISCLIAAEDGHHITGSFIAGDPEVHRGDV